MPHAMHRVDRCRGHAFPASDECTKSLQRRHFRQIFGFGPWVGAHGSIWQKSCRRWCVISAQQHSTLECVDRCSGPFKYLRRPPRTSPTSRVAAFFGPAGQFQFAGNNRRTEAGYTVGAGIEHAFASNWTVKGEYIYYDFRDETVNVAVVPGGGGGGTGYNRRFENDGHIVRAGLNYKFGAISRR